MNIEEERKAFEAVVLPGGVFAAVTWDGERYSMPGVSCMTQDLFTVWCKAKAHAEEMAKPCKIPRCPSCGCDQRFNGCFCETLK